MPNRFQSSQRNAIYPFIAERDGEYCIACFIEKGFRRGPGSVKLEIDHADGNKHNWDPRNLHLLCKTHNLKYRSLSSRAHVSLLAGYSAVNVSVCVKNNEYKSATKRAVSYSEGSPEMKVNSIAESNWLNYMHSMIDQDGSITIDDSVKAGAIAADDVCIQTTGRYLAKHSSSLGRFQIKVQNGSKRVYFREFDLHGFGNNHDGKNGHQAGIKDTIELEAEVDSSTLRQS